MNLSELTKEQLNKFCKKFDCCLGAFKPSFDGTYYLKMFSCAMGPQPEFSVTENSCIGINYYKNYDITKQWVKFLTEIETNKEQNIEQTL